MYFEEHLQVISSKKFPKPSTEPCKVPYVSEKYISRLLTFKLLTFTNSSYIIFTSIFTPDGKLKLVNASITFGFGLIMSISLL